MLFSKKLVVLISAVLLVPPAWAEISSQGQAVVDSVTTSPEWKAENGDFHWLTDKEAMTPVSSGSGNNCQKNPNETLKLMEEIEKKHMCTADLSYGECYALMMAGAAGGAAAAGSMTARKAAVAGAMDVGPEDFICNDKNPFSMRSLLLSEAVAGTPIAPGKFCFVRSQESVTRSAEQLQKKLVKERNDSIDRALEPKVKETPEQSARRVAQAEKDLIEMAEKYRDKIKAGGLPANVKRSEELIKNLDINIKNRRMDYLFSLMDLTSDSYFPRGGAVDHSRLQAAFQRVNSAPAAKISADKAEQIANVKAALTNSGLSDDFLREKIKTLGPEFNPDEILKQRKYWNDLTRAQSEVFRAASSYKTQLIDESQFYKALGQAQLQASKDPSIVPGMEDLIRFAENFGNKIRFTQAAESFDVMSAVRSLRSKAGTIITTGAKAAMAAPTPPELALSLMGTYSNGDCLDHIKLDTAQGKSRYYLAGFSYLKYDKESCKPELEYNKEFKEFMQLSPMARLKMARYNDILCKQIFELAYKDSLAAKSEISCESPGRFSVTEKANPKVQERMQREMAEAKLSPPEQAEYIKAHSQIGYSAQVEVAGENYKFNLPQITERSCQNFSVQLTSNTPSETRGVCKPATNFVTQNIYEISQIAKCCAGDSVSYCEAFKSKFVTSAAGSQSGGTRSDSVKTRR